MVVAAIIGFSQFALAVDSAAKFASPHDERIVQQVSFFQILNQARQLVGPCRSTASSCGRASCRAGPSPYETTE